MNKHSLKRHIAAFSQLHLLNFLVHWLLLATIIGVLTGSLSAFFLTSLDWVTQYREDHTGIIALLPFAGLMIGLSYHYYGESVVKGNNLLLEEFHTPKKVIPFRMIPLVLSGTLLTHLFGGSAGREGTAVQMGGAIADRFSHWFHFKKEDRKTILIMGISAGFASVFGTPLAGAVFALEVMIMGRIRYEAILPAFLVAAIAHYTCLAWQVTHTHYTIPFVPELTPITLLWTVLTGILFGCAALIFSKSTHFWSDFFKKKIAYPPLRPFIGGIVIALAVYLLGTTEYIGLGIPTLQAAFYTDMASYDFIAKILFTSFTLGAGFKGGEVTPLFFIGATLGNVLCCFVPLPMALLAGMGFVAVFSGATNTPIACTLMGIELFGAESGLYIGIACVTAYLFSGHTGIYTSQIIGSPKHQFYLRLKGKHLWDVKDKKNKE